jgi:hypothetical protein
MRPESLVFWLAALPLSIVSPVCAQTSEVSLDPAHPKITTVSAMRARRDPQVAAEEVMRLKLGTVVNAVARSSNQETIGGKTDYWYRVGLPNGGSGWLFGGLLLDYAPGRRQELLRQIIEARLAAMNTGFKDREELYNFVSEAVAEARDANARAEFELFKLLAFTHWAGSIPDDQRGKSPYREWLRAHNSEVIHNEFGGGYDVLTELFWNLEAKYRTLAVADRIAWEAVQNEEPSDCESDEVCAFLVFGERQVKYLSLHPNGAHAAEAVQSLTEMITDEVIETANSKGGDKYVAEQRAALRKSLASLWLALPKTSSPGKDQLRRKLEKVKPANALYLGPEGHGKTSPEISISSSTRHPR